ncbi:MAG TPA: type I glyceraldehyde-3-phosphate dehydrogenase [Dehalococcoidia bacterium]|nr:type I glyceraldehyde-3-phosphate dehydrogenase [Dehalococcoidia bacterium]
MTLRVGINGFGRTGRQAFRAWYQRRQDDFEIVAINGRTPVDMHTHLLRHDSDYGAFPAEVVNGDDSFTVNNNGNSHTVKVFEEEQPDDIDWSSLDIDLVIDSTGAFRDRAGASRHLGGSVKKVLISAPAKDEDWTVIMGVNDEQYDPAAHNIVSAGSCTTNCVVPVVKVLHDNFGIDRGFMTTIHAYTRDQNLVDSKHKDLRRARAAGLSIIPTSTGAAAAVGGVIPELQGKFDGIAYRVPTPVVSVVDLVTDLSQSASEGEINEAFLSAADGPMKGYLVYEREELVSSDFKENPASSIFDAPSTMVLDGGMAKTMSWYDNEWGYSCRLTDVIAMIAERGVD